MSSIQDLIIITSLIIVIPSSIFIALVNPFARQAIIQLFWITFYHVFPHSPVDFPRFNNPEQAEKDVINPAFLSRALTKKARLLSPKAKEVKVHSAKAKRMGHDMGNASTMFRMDITFANTDVEQPTRLIIKLPKADLKNRIPFTATRMNEMESRFYGSTLCDELKDEHGIELVRGFGGQYAQRGGASFSIMEDVTLRGGKFTTEQDEIKVFQDAADAIRSVARFHAPLFDAEQRFQTDLNWIIHQQDAVLCMTKQFYLYGWATFLQRLGHVVPDEIHQRGKDVHHVAQQLHDYMGLPPNTLVHGDCHLENAYFVHQENGTKTLGLYDMQLMRRAKGALDVASFLGGSVSPTLLGGGAFDEDGELTLLNIYYNELRSRRGNGPLMYTSSAGVKIEYTMEDLKRDYKMGLALLFVWNVAAALAVPFDTSATADYDAYATRLIKSTYRTSALNYALWYLGVPGVARSLGLRGQTPKFPEGLPPIQRTVPGVATNPAQVHLYRSQHSPALPTGMIDALKRQLKYWFVWWMTSSKKGHHGQKLTDVPFDVLEGHKSVDHAVGTIMENHVFDSYYVSGFSSHGGPCLSLRWCRRYRENKGEVWLALRIPGEGIFVWVDHPTTECLCVEQDKNTVVVTPPNPGGGGGTRMSLTCVIPMVEWRVAFTGKLKRMRTGEITECNFTITVKNVMPHFSFGTDVSPSLTAEALASEPFSREFFDELKASHQEHYEVFTSLEGRIAFPQLGLTFPLLARGMRDRAFGVREWGYMQRYVSSYFWGGDNVQDGPCFNTTFAALPTLTRGRFGFVSSGNGVKGVPFSKMSGDLATMSEDGIPAKDFEMAFICDGVHYCVRAYVTDGDSVGLNMGPGGMWVNLRFATFDIRWIDEHCTLRQIRGVGASEFGYRFDGVRPHRPTKGEFKPVAMVTSD